MLGLAKFSLILVHRIQFSQVLRNQSGLWHLKLEAYLGSRAVENMENNNSILERTNSYFMLSHLLDSGN